MNKPQPPETSALQGPSAARQPWWMSAVGYQIYPLSFADSDGDGVGDLRGVIDHLDHIEDLGVDVIWLSPVYDSPHDDNGYDIRDYRSVDPRFGTLADLDELIAAVHRSGMRIVMDLVVNHTSDEHEWFLASRESRAGSTADWYIWRDPRPGHTGGEPGAEPNNWGSFFSGSAWEYVAERDQYYLHLFSRKQPDLNWECAELRAAVFDMMNWWLDRGIDGFRMDVINFISKDHELPDGATGASGFGDGSPYFRHGPRLEEFLDEMNREVFARRDQDFLTIGEMPMVTADEAKRFTDRETGQLSMVFQFEHVDLDHGESKWDPREATVLDLKHSLGRWQEAMGTRGWNSLYWSNHDQPRVVSRFGDPDEFWYESATALATVLYLQRGTPFIFQGEEIGMRNVSFADISAFRDIESINYYHHAVDVTRKRPDDVLRVLATKSRDNARAPMQWSAAANAGFTSGEPWMPVSGDHGDVNAQAQYDDPGSVFSFYRRLLALRHREAVLSRGDFTMLLPDDASLYAYRRGSDAETVTVVVNLSGDAIPVDGVDGLLLLDNYETAGRALTPGALQPWEARVQRGAASLRRTEGQT